mmetsp:Transcript_16885/g.35443  ORF Transcript_16885/g.35443 Transcript_16885/m.35443 type:complete len:332 (+) Transcript_16885:116-1111(+)|eukprot:CAMPEP_0171337996 /NCGR_PEP_ID=MMETSP0878-20121228/7041_1 /TAXON_ID=67004 /ORGANISM="Thalassiosira weissflogii, Strain CCMP1336" /LENGTH=331 /DNA_ID=CAMNT_0011839705 /DNA_START=41 /DNA_END=1036 /DNA_ORIENTATION=-
MSFNQLAAVDGVAMHPPREEAREQQQQQQHHEPVAAVDPAPPREAAQPNANYDFHSRAQVRRAVHAILGRLLRRSLVNVQRREAMMMVAAAGRGPRGVLGSAARGDDPRNDGAAARLGPVPAPAPPAGPRAGPQAAPAPRRPPQLAPGVHPAMLLTPRQNRLLLLRQSFLFEDILYKRAISREEYLDRDTLEDRIFLVGRAVGRAWTLRVERQHGRSAGQNGGVGDRRNEDHTERGNHVGRINNSNSNSGQRNSDRVLNVRVGDYSSDGRRHYHMAMRQMQRRREEQAAAREQARLEERDGENGDEIENAGTAVWRRGKDGSGRLVRSACS